MEYATVARINWGDGTVDLLANDGTPRIDVPWLGKYPPPPLSSVLVDDVGGQPIVRGPAGERRLVFHDDFLFVGAIGLVPRYGDTPWTFPILGDNGTVTGIGDGIGVARLTTDDGNTTIGLIKTATNTNFAAGVGHWVSGRVRSPQFNNNSSIFGFRNADGTGAMALGVDVPLNGRIWTVFANNSSGSGLATTVEGTPLTDDEWYNLDVVVVGGHSVSGWVDGNGPTSITDTGFLPTGGLAPYFDCAAVSVPSARTMDIDWMHFETFEVGVRPQRIVEVFA